MTAIRGDAPKRGRPQPAPPRCRQEAVLWSLLVLRLAVEREW